MPRWLQDYGLVALIAIVVVGWFAMERPEHVPAGGPAPQVVLTLIDGQRFDLHKHRGKPVLLVFWAQWCGPCKAEIPHLNRLYREHGDDIDILGIAMDSGDNAAVKGHARRLGIEYPVGAGDPLIAEQYGVTAFPTSVFIDADGNISRTVVGGLDYSDLTSLLSG